MTAGAALVAVDGVSAAAVHGAAKRIVSAHRPRGRGGISRWDASGLFEELLLAGDGAGMPSARTLLLLYAADLAFRLRWEIEPALTEGRMVVAAPYVDTAVAFGRAAGLPAGWLTSLFKFAMPPTTRHHLEQPQSRRLKSARQGFVELGCTLLADRQWGLTRQELMARARGHLGKGVSSKRR